LVPVLATKLYAPPPRPDLVRRRRLIDRLDEGSQGRLTLVCAPAGCGKTTTISAWIAGRAGDPPDRTAWLSLDEGDDDLARFLTYLVAALRTVAPDLGDGVLGMLRAPRPPSTESMLTDLINEIAALGHGLVVVLDDYHVIDSEPVDRAVEFLIDHLPPQLHLVVAGRDEPRLPLARWRARGVLTELRAADLRFTNAETADFLTTVMGLDLCRADIAALEARTEGWIAGLQLAALSLQGRPEVGDVVRTFTGSNRFVFDYLVEEVLRGRPDRERRFLLRTAVLDRLNGDLCDAVTQQRDGDQMLEHLERANLFVVALDDRRRWYRYHHLFADVLRARLLVELPDQVPALHRRASDWLEENGFRLDAIRHALRAGDVERAADLIELAGPVVEESSQAALWIDLARALPDELVRTRPVLSVWYAYALLGRGDLETAETRLTDAERRLAAPDAADLPPASRVVDDDQLRSLRATIAVARAYRAQSVGDVPGTVEQARRALELAPEGDQLRRDQATALMGMTYWAGGDLEAADHIFTAYSRRLLAAGNLQDAISTACVLADLRPVLGRLRAAADTLEGLLQAVLGRGEPPPADTADLYRGLGELDLVRGDLAAAATHLTLSRDLGEHAELPVWRYRWRLAQARLRQAEGDREGALGLLDEGERLFIRTPMPDVRPIGALRARIWTAQGRLNTALAWARDRNLTVDDDLDYLHEFEHLTLASVLIARNEHEGDATAGHDAAGLLERLLQAAQQGGRLGSVIEVLALQALAHQAMGHPSSAVASLERALSLAEPEGYVGVFAAEGPPMTRLLTDAAARTTAPDRARRLLTAFPSAGPQDARSSGTVYAGPEALSRREVEVLRHIAAGLTNQQIAAELYLSLYTVKAHARTIYDKLGAHSRTRAVARARELGILPGPDHHGGAGPAR
jgi:LuxR family maltose regulon positive regulatory protein